MSETNCYICKAPVVSVGPHFTFKDTLVYKCECGTTAMKLEYSKFARIYVKLACLARVAQHAN